MNLHLARRGQQPNAARERIVAVAIAGGADIVRVHDVKEMSRVARVADAIVRGWKEEK